MNAKPWIEATRLRTLPVSAAGVLAGCAVSISYNSFKWLPALICFILAIAANQVTKIAKEYIDLKNSLE
ncbi:MAG: hypothetical protein K2L00_03870, partial [Muribaculaceae bacterium]|nr:hypothetical protein [Muribaculaceae bacterium]